MTLKTKTQFGSQSLGAFSGQTKSTEEKKKATPAVEAPKAEVPQKTPAQDETYMKQSKSASEQFRQQRESDAKTGELRAFVPTTGGYSLQTALNQKLATPLAESAGTPSAAGVLSTSVGQAPSAAGVGQRVEPTTLESAFGATPTSMLGSQEGALAHYGQNDAKFAKMVKAASSEPPGNEILHSFGIQHPKSPDGQSLLERHGITGADIKEYAATGKMSQAMQQAYVTAGTMPEKQWGEPITRFHEAQAITQLMHRVAKSKIQSDRKDVMSQKVSVQKDPALSTEQKSARLKGLDGQLDGLRQREVDAYEKGLLPALLSGRRQNKAWIGQVSREAERNAAKAKDPLSKPGETVSAGTKADTQYAALARGARFEGDHVKAAGLETQRADVQSTVFSKMGVAVKPNDLSGIKNAKADLAKVENKNTAEFHGASAELNLTTAKAGDRYIETKGLSVNRENSQDAIGKLSPGAQRDVGQVAAQTLQARNDASGDLNKQIGLLKGKGNLSMEDKASLNVASQKLAVNENELRVKGKQYTALSELKDVKVPEGGRATDFPGANYLELSESKKIPTHALDLGGSVEERKKIAAQFHQLGKGDDNGKGAFNNGCGPTALLMAAYLDKDDPKGQLTKIADTSLSYLKDEGVKGAIPKDKLGKLKTQLDGIKGKIEAGTATTADLKELQEATYAVMSAKENDSTEALQESTMTDFMSKSGLDKSMKKNGMELKRIDTGQDLRGPTGHYVLSGGGGGADGYIYDPWPRKGGDQIVTGKGREVYNNSVDGKPAPNSTRAISQEVWKEFKNTKSSETGNQQEMVKKLYALDQEDFDDFVMKMIAHEHGENSLPYPPKFSQFVDKLTYDERLRFKASYDRLKGSGRIRKELSDTFEDPRRNDKYAYIFKGEKTTWETIWPWSYGGKTDW